MSKIEKWKTRNNIDGMCTADMNDIDELIQLVRDECEPKWVSVDDALPEKCQHNEYSKSVTAYCENNKCQYTACYDYRNPEKPDCMCISNTDGCECSNCLEVIGNIHQNPDLIK